MWNRRLLWSCMLLVAGWRVELRAAEMPTIELFAGTWQATEQQTSAPLLEGTLHSPFGIDFDDAGTAWIVELEGQRVFRSDNQGHLQLAAGNGHEGYAGDGELAAHGLFKGMHNVAVMPRGDVFIADSWNHCVRRIASETGRLSTVIGALDAGDRGDGGPAQDARFSDIMCVSLNPTHDRLFLADIQNRRVRVVDLATNLVTLVAGNGESGVPADGAIAVNSPLVDPRAVAVDSQNNVYILERSGHALRVVTPAGRIYTVAGTGEAGFADGPAHTAQFNSPKHLCVGANDHVFIADDTNARIRQYDPQTKQIRTVLGGGAGHAAIKLHKPHGVTYKKGFLYIVDSGNNRILRWRMDSATINPSSTP